MVFYIWDATACIFFLPNLFVSSRVHSLNSLFQQQMKFQVFFDVGGGFFVCLFVLKVMAMFWAA